MLETIDSINAMSNQDQRFQKPLLTKEDMDE